MIASPGACNFNMEEDQWEESCQLSQDLDDDFDWRISQKTETPGAGPQTDHSPGLNQKLHKQNTEPLSECIS